MDDMKELRNEELAGVTGGAADEEYLYVIYGGSYVYTNERKSEMLKICETVRTDNPGYSVRCEFVRGLDDSLPRGMQLIIADPTYKEVSVGALLEYYERCGGEIKRSI